MKIRLFLGFCVLFAVIAPADAAQGQKDYFAVFLEGKKVGHAFQGRDVAGGKVTTTVDVSLTISRAGVPITITTSETHVETTDGRPLSFEAVQELSAIKMRVAGTISPQGEIHVTMASLGTEQNKTMPWPRGAVMSEGLRLLSAKKGLKEGTTYTVRMFNPTLLQAVDAKVRVGPKRNVDLLGRVVSLTEMVTTMTLPAAGEVVSTSYVDEDLREQKTTTPMAGMQIEMVACPKDFALGENDVLEVVKKLFIESPRPLNDIGSAESATYHISPTPGADPHIPSNDNQKVKRLKNGRIIVNVRPVEPPSGAKFPYKGTDESLLAATRPTRFLQSDHKQIIDLARRAVGDTKDAAEAARRIESFVAEYITNKSLSIGYASAAEVADSKQGDCSEFAVLTAAMCRAIGIPAQVVTGVAYVDDFMGARGFGGHAWTQAYIGDRWIGLDAAFKSAGRAGYDPGHIALAAGNGNPESFFDLVGSLGQFKIDEVIVNRSQ